VLQELLMDILRALASPNSDIREKTLDITMALISPRNIEEVVNVLKREIVKTSDKGMENSSKYRQMLIKAIHTCAVKFPDVAHSVVHMLMDFLNDDGAVDVILFVRTIVQQYEALRQSVVEKLITCLPDIKAARVYRVALWVVGEFCEEPADVESGLDAVRTGMGDLPLKAVVDNSEVKPDAGGEKEEEVVMKTVQLSDGTYGTEMISTGKGVADKDDDEPMLRKLLTAGDTFLGSVVATTLTKLVMKTMETHGDSSKTAKEAVMDAMLRLCALAELASTSDKTVVQSDSLERIVLCLRMLANPAAATVLKDTWLKDCRNSFAAMLEANDESNEEEEEEQVVSAQADDLISIRQLRGTKVLGSTEIDIDDGDMSRATGGDQTDFSERLNHVHQLSGFADPVYAEAYVTVHDYDIVLEILVINRTNQQLTNLQIELATMGDLKIVERPQTYTIGPNEQRTIKANIKVSSTETGHIFGTIVYDSAAAEDAEPGAPREKVIVNLNDIHLDIMDYICPASCSDAAFRSMWAEFEWENKVAVNTSLSDVTGFLNHIVDHTNMKCMTPTSALGGDCNFLAANLYAKSIFGEDALVNVSIEKQDDGKIVGYIRIRSKTQGIALSLGDRITAVQRG